MTNEANLAHAAKLLALAEAYGTATETIHTPSIGIHVDTKEELLIAIRAVGGKWKKEVSETFVYLCSEKIPGFSVSIWRDKVCCRITPIYECEPLLSPEEDVEIMEAANA